MKMLEKEVIPTKSTPGFMEDPNMGATAWGIPHKTEADLGPNGWDRFVGRENLQCLAIDTDHLGMLTPKYVHLLGDAMEQAFAHFRR